MSGLLGKSNTPANTNTTLYTVPANKIATANINLCNRTNAVVTVRIAIHTGTIADADYLEYDAVIPAHGVMERSGIVLSAGEKITIRPSAAISARAHGFEESL